jgi:FkbM family methyltransferase
MTQFSVDKIAGHSFVGSWLVRDSVVVDLGMNLGNFSYAVSKRYGCRVTGVEANPALAQAILQTDRLSCRNLAITGKSGPLEFFVDPSDLEASTTHPQGCIDELQRVVVEGRTFEDFVTSEQLQHIDLLKIDIEGAELDLLEFTPDPLLDSIRQICVEFHGFVRPQDVPRIKAAIGRMRARNFFVLDFARDLSNVLMINERNNHLTFIERATLHSARNASGIKRMITRALHA